MKGIMNRKNQWLRIAIGTGFALALAVAWSPVSVQAADPIKGGQKLIQLQPIKSVQEIQSLEPGDSIVMSCPKCKTVTVIYVDNEAKAGSVLNAGAKPTKTAAQHLCPGCRTEFEYKGHGKNQQERIVHKCGTCGSKDAFCCVMKKEDALRKGK
jgi:hypothetical protein